MEPKIINHIDKVFEICREYGAEYQPEVNWREGWLSVQSYLVVDDFLIHLDVTLMPLEDIIWVTASNVGVEGSPLICTKVCDEYSAGGGYGAFLPSEADSALHCELNIFGVKQLKHFDQSYDSVSECVVEMVDGAVFLGEKTIKESGNYANWSGFFFADEGLSEQTHGRIRGNFLLFESEIPQPVEEWMYVPGGNAGELSIYTKEEWESKDGFAYEGISDNVFCEQNLDEKYIWEFELPDEIAGWLGGDYATSKVGIDLDERTGAISVHVQSDKDVYMRSIRPSEENSHYPEAAKRSAPIVSLIATRAIMGTPCSPTDLAFIDVIEQVAKTIDGDEDLESKIEPGDLVNLMQDIELIRALNAKLSD